MELSHTEKDDIRKVLQPVFGRQVSTWEISPAFAEVFADYVTRVQKTCPAMKLVPRFMHPGLEARRYVMRELRRIARTMATETNQMNLHCMRAAGLGMRTEFELAR